MYKARETAKTTEVRSCRHSSVWIAYSACAFVYGKKTERLEIMERDTVSTGRTYSSGHHRQS